MINHVRLIRKELGLTQEELASKLGIKKSALSMIETGRAALSERNKNILVQVLNINPEWFENPKAEMRIMPGSWTPRVGITDRVLSVQSVPLYDVEATAGLVPLFADKADFDPIDYIHIPNLPKCDGAIYVVGDSMYPLLKSGDIVLYKQINDIEDNILWGEMYLLSLDIDGDEYVMVKYIQKSDKAGYIRLVSQNVHHADKDIELSRIKALAFVKASVRINSLR